MAFPVKGIFKLTGKLLRQGAIPLMLVTVGLYFLPVFGLRYGSAFLIRIAWGSFLMADDGGLGILGLTTVAINWILNAFHMSAVTEIALRTAAEKPVRPGPLIITALVNAFPVLIMQVALELITGVGAWLLLIPGLFLGAALSIVVPTYVCEGKGIVEAFRRAFRLTQDRRWPIAATWLAIGVPLYIFGGHFLLSEITTWLTLPHQWVPAIPMPPLPVRPYIDGLSLFAIQIGRMAINTVLIVLNVAIYLTLRFSKTDQGDNRVAEIFE